MNLPKKALSLILSMALVFTCIFTVNLKQSAKTSEAATTNVLLLKGTASGSKNVKLSWNKISGTTEYVLTTSKEGSAQNASTEISKSKTSYTAKKWGKKAFSKNSCYTFMLKAYKGNTCIATSKKIYVITSNYSGKYSNATKIKASFTKASIRVSDSKTLSAKLTQYKNKKQKNAWGATTFVSSNTDIAKVTSKGKITAVKKGTVKIYTIAPNGLYATTTVTVLDKIYSIAFDSNGGIGDAIEPISMKYNSSKKLPANTFTFAGQTFAGWALTSNATEPTYKDEASVKNLTDVNGATVTLYAVWTPNQYALDFKAYPAGLSTNIRNATVTYGKAYGALPEVSEREGYTFIGWYTDPENGGEKITAETIFIGSEAVTLYARWEKDPED